MPEASTAVSRHPEPVETRHRIHLPLTTLNCAVCGDGEPLILVPATISLIDDWLPYIRFVGQRYQVHFFELPGHGGSTPFDRPFSSALVAEAIEQYADECGLGTFALAGFSFGGVITMRTLQRLGERVTKVMLFSPFVSNDGLQHSSPRLQAVRAAAASARRPIGRAAWLWAMHNPVAVRAFAWFMTSIGKYETAADLKARLFAFPDSSFDTLACQVAEILSTVEADLVGPYPQPCYFGMSRNDPLLDFRVSRDFIISQFADVRMEEWDFPFHAPPEPFTFKELNERFAGFLSAFDDR